MNLENLKARARAWLVRARTLLVALRARVVPVREWLQRHRTTVLGIALVLGLVVALWMWMAGAAPSVAVHTAEHTVATQQLDARLGAIERVVAELQAAQITAASAPVTARVRTPAPRATAAPAEPAPPVAAWSQPTDLDRAIDRFSTTLQEPSK